MEENEQELLSISLYDMNKQVCNNLTALSSSEIQSKKDIIANWIDNTPDSYFMLLCHERRDYTLFSITAGRELEAANEVIDVLDWRGIILAIDLIPEGKAFEIWVRIEEENFVYYLFPYDLGVIVV